MDAEPLYMMSVAARLARLHPQTLREYHRRKAVIPSRTVGGTRLYSPADVERAVSIAQLTRHHRCPIEIAVWILDHPDGTADGATRSATR